MVPPVNKKHIHHILPRLYLNGFAETDKSPFVWVYRKGETFFSPGPKNSIRYNPYHYPISKAGARRDYYALKKPKAKTDFNTYENKLERLEKPSDPIFNKIRHYLKQEQLTPEEKLIFSAYILVMIKRVPSERERISKIFWPKIVASTEDRLTKQFQEFKAQADLTDPAKAAIYQRREKEIAELINEWRKGIPEDLRLEAIVNRTEINFPGILSKMTWQFWVAPDQEEFFTCDNPVFYFTEFGIKNIYAELSFPISKKVALVASWQDLAEGFFLADHEKVDIINERTALIATHELYAASASEVIYNYSTRNSEISKIIKLIYPPYVLYRNIPSLT